MLPSDGSKWVPTSKITAVFVAGTIYSFAVTVLTEVYGVELNPIDVTWNMLWFTSLAGYGATEHRPSQTLMDRLQDRKNRDR